MGADRKQPPFLNIYKDRHDRQRIYFRRKGYRSKALPTPLYSDAFWAAYQEAIKASPLPKKPIGADRVTSGSMDEVIIAYYRSPDFQSLASSTKKTYRGIIERFRSAHGDKLVAGLERRHVRKMYQEKADTPAAANNWLRVLHLLMRQAMEMELRDDDPTLGIRKIRLKSKGFTSWQETDIDAFIARHPSGTKPYLALMLLLHTGLRRSDVIRVGPQHIRNGVLTIDQTKTGVEVCIPVHPDLDAALKDRPAGGLVFLKTEHGKPFSPAGFGNWFRTVTDRAGLKGLTAHGLRKAIARRLAEAGCTPHEIMAITGHQNLKEVVLYTAAANRAQMARSAMDRLSDKSE